MRITVLHIRNAWTPEGPDYVCTQTNIGRFGLQTPKRGPLTQGCWTVENDFSELKKTLACCRQGVLELTADPRARQSVWVYGEWGNGHRVVFFRKGIAGRIWREPEVPWTDTRSRLVNLIMDYLTAPDGAPLFGVIHDYIMDHVFSPEVCAREG